MPINNHSESQGPKPKGKLRAWIEREEAKTVEWWYRLLEVRWLQDCGLWPIRNLELVALLLTIFGIAIMLALAIWLCE